MTFPRRSRCWLAATAISFAACSSTPGSSSSTSTGGSGSSGSPSITGTSGSSGASSGSGSGGTDPGVLTGTPALTFPVLFAGYTTVTTGCCGQDYQALVVGLSNDGTLATFCADGGPGVGLRNAGDYDLGLEIVPDGGPVTAGNYAVGTPYNAITPGTQLSESSPPDSGFGQNTFFGYATSGTIDLTSVAGPVTGTFDVQMLYEDGGVPGQLSGSFNAVACPGLAAAFMSACPAGPCL